MSDDTKVGEIPLNINVGGDGGRHWQDDAADNRGGAHAGGSDEDKVVIATKEPILISSHVQTAKTGRCWILCFDGSAEWGDFISNVLSFNILLWRDKDRQLMYYQPGVGTIFSGTYRIITLSVKQRIIRGYEFLMQNYEKGDRICLFGFSSGAYIARALAGMLHAVGLLEKSDEESLDAVYELYARDDKQFSKLIKETRSCPVEIEFVGVWETTKSYKMLPYMEANPSVKTFRHAMALDERRIKFSPVHYTYARAQAEDSARGDALAAEAAGTQVRGERIFAPTTTREVWFVGCHSNLGGGSGSIKSTSASRLQHVALRWMVGECFDADTKILFMADALRKLLENSSEEDRLAAIDPDGIKDELFSRFKKMLWWALEFIPTFNNARDRSLWNCLRLPNFFRGRTIPGDVVECHSTVKMRMDAEALNYVPKANWPDHSIRDDSSWVDSKLQRVRDLLSKPGHV